jgi:hypothetical protein
VYYGGDAIELLLAVSVLASGTPVPDVPSPMTDAESGRRVGRPERGCRSVDRPGIARRAPGPDRT